MPLKTVEVTELKIEQKNQFLRSTKESTKIHLTERIRNPLKMQESKRQRDKRTNRKVGKEQVII